MSTADKTRVSLPIGRYHQSCSLINSQMYRVWCRKLTPNPDNIYSSCWQDMPYAPRDKQGATALMQRYQAEFGEVFEYLIRQVSSPPQPAMPGSPLW